MRACLTAAALACAGWCVTASALAQVPPEDALLARNLAATCAACHGTDGRATGPMKTLAGLKAEAIVAALADFKSGATSATVMQQISRGYSASQIGLIAAYFASQPARHE